MLENNRFIIWGSAGHAKVLAEIITLRGGAVVALFDNKAVISALEGVAVHIGENSFQDWILSQKDVHTLSGLVAIGGGRGRDRIHVQNLFRRYGVRLPVVSHPSAVISRDATIGDGSQILALANIASGVRIGDACIVNHKASVDHESTIGNGTHIAPGATLCGCVQVEDNVLIGAGSTILPRIIIGTNSIVGAGAVVTQNVPPNTIVTGVPAKPFAF
jgi:sugar O-acyltransferase (sialic acid O-acetyltransferase NeuD family)